MTHVAAEESRGFIVPSSVVNVRGAIEWGSWFALCPEEKIGVLLHRSPVCLVTFPLPLVPGYVDNSEPLFLPQFPTRLDDTSGKVAFTPRSFRQPPLVIVTDRHHGSAHLVDPFSRKHAGYLGTRFCVPNAGAVACRGTWAAITYGVHEGMIALFEGAGVNWGMQKTVWRPPPWRMITYTALEFNAEGSVLLVTNSADGRVSQLTVATGTFDTDLVVGLHNPRACIMARDALYALHFVHLRSTPVMISGPDHAALVPFNCVQSDYGLGYPIFISMAACDEGVVLSFGGATLYLVPFHDRVLQATMSQLRVAWMETVYRGVRRRRVAAAAAAAAAAAPAKRQRRAGKR